MIKIIYTSHETYVTTDKLFNQCCKHLVKSQQIYSWRLVNNNNYCKFFYQKQ